MQLVNAWMTAINAVLWHDYVLFVILGVGVLFTVWSGFTQWHALTHGVDIVRGKYDEPGDPGAVNHFQALSTALSATVGLGNIGGVALAIALGGPGAVFWMWVVGFFGMAVKATEVTLAMLYRDTSDPKNPRGGPMWVARRGFAEMNPKLAGVGRFVGGAFCATLLVSTMTGGNMFQAWNVAILGDRYFGIPGVVTGVITAVLVALVIIGGIQRIGAVASRLVPFMCIFYLLGAAYVVIMRIDEVPEMLDLILRSAFAPAEAQGAFLGGTAGFAFLSGMKRALFSNEAGQGSAPIAHAAARTKEPVREGIVAGLEPFIDTLIVCTLTALVILLSGAWNRGPEVRFAEPPEVVGEPGAWTVSTPALPPKSPAQAAISEQWKVGDSVFMIVRSRSDPDTAADMRRLPGVVRQAALIVTADGATVQGRIVDETDETVTVEAAGNDGIVIRSIPVADISRIDRQQFVVEWGSAAVAGRPRIDDPGVYVDYVGAYLTGHAFDRVHPGLGRWLVTFAAALFAFSTIISWNYYGEQGIIYLFGQRAVIPYRVIYCLLIVVASAGFITNDAELDNLTGLGTGVMLFANIPIMLIFGGVAMRAYRDYIHRWRSGQTGSAHAARSMVDLMEESDRPQR